MTRTLALSLAIAIFSAPAFPVDLTAPVEKIITNYIRPATAAFAETSKTLPVSVSALCAEPTDTNRANFKRAFSETLRTFSRVHFLRFGPLVEADRLNRLSFLPDPRGIAQRQIRKIYAAGDKSVLSLNSLQDKSVAVQSMTALELIAFDKSTNLTLANESENRDFTCQYALAIAENIAAIAQATALEWQRMDGYSAVLLTPGPANQSYRTPKEALESIFNAIATGITIMKDQDVLPALSSSPEKARPTRFPYSRSGNSLLYLRSELQGIQDALNSMDLSALLSSESAWLIRSLDFEFKNSGNYLAKQQAPLRLTFSEGESYKLMSALAVTLNSIRGSISGRLSEDIGLSGGFNALDGD